MELVSIIVCHGQNTMNPAEFSDDQYFAILGGLLIEQSLLGIHGEIIAGSGLTEILEVNNLSLVGASTAALESDIKRS